MEDKKYPRVFKKAIKGSVGGRYLNSRGEYDEFLLVGDPATAEIEKVTVEVFNEEAEKYFYKSNKTALVNGYLVEITEGYEMKLDEVNAVSDGFLKDLLKQPYMKMKKRVEEFTSPVPIERLLTLARAENKPVKTVEFIEGALKKFNSASLPNVAQLDNVKIGATGG
jgi:hypothetical protein